MVRGTMLGRLTVLALCAAGALCASPALAADPDLGGEWHLDELTGSDGATALDSSNHANDLDTGGGITVVPGGRFGNAIDFSQGGAAARSTTTGPAPTSNAEKPKGKPTAKRCAPSNATSHAASTNA